MPCPLLDGIRALPEILDIRRDGGVADQSSFTLLAKILDASQRVLVLPNTSIPQPKTVLECGDQEHQKEQKFGQGRARVAQKAWLNALRPA